jgi:zinc transport system substrate-binding protein
MKALGDRVKKEEVVEGMQADPSASSGTEEHHEHDKVTEPAEATSEHHHHEEVENDEHIWLSLKNAWILVNARAQSLSKVDSANSSIYTANAVLYNAKLWEMDKEFATAVSNASQKTVLFGDRFPFRYLVDDYGIKYYAAFVGCSAESEASFETVTFLAGKMDSLQLPAIFTIDGSNGKIARAILDASKNSKNAQVLTLNSMQSVTDEQIKAGADYLSIMRDNLEVLKKALK